MIPGGAILDRWVESSFRAYPAATAQFLGSETDPFRNPVGHTLRENLEIILHGLLGDMDGESTNSAIDAIVRMRAVQNLTAGEALGFIFQVRPILRDMLPRYDESIDVKVDALALQAFEAYVRCREQLSELRLNESRRAMELTIARSRGCRQ